MGQELDVVQKLEKRKLYVLGPLEIAPGNFAVGETSYAAIKGKFPHYNALRQKLYEQKKTAAADAIGELETCLMTAETELRKTTTAKESAERRIESLEKELAKERDNRAADVKHLKKEMRKTRMTKLKNSDELKNNDLVQALIGENRELLEALTPFAECKVANDVKNEESYNGVIRAKNLRVAKELVARLEEEKKEEANKTSKELGKIAEEINKAAERINKISEGETND
jgi:hypothetical protein